MELSDYLHSASASPATSPSSLWIRSIQNESFQPKPTAYSPHSLEDEDPLMLQQRQCRDKLRVLKQVRERIEFYPLRPIDGVFPTSYSMKISTNMILSSADLSPEWQQDANQSDGQSKNAGQNVGIDALGGLEMLLFAFFSPHELLHVSSVCRAWRSLARDDLFWEPLLFTTVEKYPLRPLLGLERDSTHSHKDVPAILVYMVYQKLKIAQTAYKPECSDDGSVTHTTTTTTAPTRYNGRFLQLFQTFNQQVGALPSSPKEPVSSIHLVCVKFNPTASALWTSDRMVGLLFQPQVDQVAPVANVAVAPDPQPAVRAEHGAGAADDEDVYSVADGRDRMTLNGWLSTKRRVCERTLRSYLRQMLLAVDALEKSNCEHADISPVNIVVHYCQSRVHKMNVKGNGQSEEDSDEEEADGDDMDTSHEYCRRRTPFFQLFLSRRNCQHTRGARNWPLDPALAVDMNMNPILDGNDDIAQQRQRLAVAEAEVGGNDNGVPIAAAFRHRLALPQISMVSSVIHTAITVWACGRFVDANTSTDLALLLRYPESFSSHLRSFLEYATYLIITHSANASKLLRHEYLRCSEADLDCNLPPHWSTTPIRDVNEYKSKLVAYYGSLASRVDGLLDDNSNSISPQVIDELMPRTNLGLQYFSSALEENKLRSERFVSVVAPSTASSSWVRTLASTQSCTLQRLDLSRARVPTSVLLRELATLPRLTHLRLPRQILRDENLEHLVAALAYAKFLPQLRGLDENVRYAMDRLEKSYLMQLDMVTFLLQKPSANTTPGGV
ncbi:F-box-like [Phytophthora infestans]|uniref:F-box-like n=1 Tax=Phytophthora infestans TaxID=4787 RepID=A0A833W2S7_PHYIN|nr:F-box-like [Phytophthora infestans]